jgi:hypothetical protein
VFAAGLACALGGLGASIRGDDPEMGPVFMAIGGGLIDLAWKFGRGNRF